jgi:hypothetical protein
MKREILVLLILAGLASPVWAQGHHWSVVAKTRDHDLAYSIKIDSGHRVRARGGHLSTILVGKVVNAETHHIVFRRWYVSDADCARGYGELVSLSMVGRLEIVADFALGGGTVASRIAAFICTITRGFKEKMRRARLPLAPTSPS